MDLSNLQLDARYSKMSPDEMQGDQSAKDLIRIAMLQTGGKPGAKVITPNQIADRPGNIDWTDRGPVFNVKTPPRGATHLDMDKILQGRYISPDISQGRQIQEFVDRATKKAPAAAPAAPAAPEAPAPEPAIVAKVKAKGAPPAIIEKAKAAAAAAKVEVKAKILAAKAEATKKKALAGLGDWGYYLGATDEEVATAGAVVATTTAAMNTCMAANAANPSACDSQVASHATALARLAELTGSKIGLSKGKKITIGVALLAIILGVWLYSANVLLAGGV